MIATLTLSGSMKTATIEDVFRRLAKYRGIDPVSASERLHDLKEREGRGPADNLQVANDLLERVTHWPGPPSRLVIRGSTEYWYDRFGRTVGVLAVPGSSTTGFARWIESST